MVPNSAAARKYHARKHVALRSKASMLRDGSHREGLRYREAHNWFRDGASHSHYSYQVIRGSYRAWHAGTDDVHGNCGLYWLCSSIYTAGAAGSLLCTRAPIQAVSWSAQLQQPYNVRIRRLLHTWTNGSNGMLLM